MKIVTVGGGFAGISYARSMAKKGHDVVILEANDEIGGRVRSVEFAGRRHPLGATYDHYSETSPHKLEFPEGTPSVDAEMSDIRIIDSKGKDISAEMFEIYQNYNKYVEEFATIHHDNCQEMALEKACEGVDEKIAEYFKAFIANESCDGLPLAEFEELDDLEVYVGMSTRVTGVATDDVHVGTGMHDLLKEHARDLEHVVTGAVVIKVDQTGEKPKITYISEGKQHVIEADAVHVAVPAAVIDKIDFDPPLSPEHREAFESVVTTKVVRVLLDYDDEAIKKSGIGKDKQYIQIENDELGLFFIENRPAIEGEGTTISVFLSGDSAIAAEGMIDALGDDGLKMHLSKVINKIFPDLERPREALVKSWQRDPTAAGAWVSEHNRSKRMLAAKPFHETTFGGDFLGFDCKKTPSGKQECLDYSGTVHGAIKSGENAAKIAHAKFIGKPLYEVEVGSAWPFPGVEAGGVWQDDYARTIASDTSSSMTRDVNSGLGAVLLASLLVLGVRGAFRKKTVKKCRSSYIKHAPRLVREFEAREHVLDSSLDSLSTFASFDDKPRVRPTHIENSEEKGDLLARMQKAKAEARKLRISLKRDTKSMNANGIRKSSKIGGGKGRKSSHR